MIAPVDAVFVGVGSNHSACQNLKFAAKACREQFGSLEVAPVYESAARNGGAPYLNTVFGFASALTPEALQDALRAIETHAGRKRGGTDCALDLDLLLVGDTVREAKPVLPRPDILRDAFVLRPLAELVPNLMHPVIRSAMAELYANWRMAHPAGDGLLSVDLDLSLV